MNEKKKDEKETQEAKTFFLSKEEKEDRQEEKKISGKQLKDFQKFAEKMKTKKDSG